MTRITFPTSAATGIKSADQVLFLAPREMFENGWPGKAVPATLRARLEPLVAALLEGDRKAISSFEDKKPRQLVVASLPDRVSRHNTPCRKEEVIRAVGAARLANRSLVVAGLADREHVTGVLTGLARTLPLYDRTTGGGKSKTKGKTGGRKKKDGSVGFLSIDSRGKTIPVGRGDREVCTAAREAARLVDTPTAELTTEGFEKEARKLLRGVPGVRIKTIAGTELLKQGLGGIHAVGRAAVVQPRLVILDHRPPKAKKTVALVGKGVVYDTGGLSLKPTAGMCSMKADMGGAAAVLGAFSVLARTRCKHRVLALIPLAENSVGPRSYRPDDILTLHSGHTVEINNTDAEGRLLLADAVSYAARTYKPWAILDAATLTGAQLIATGDRHAAIMSNREGFERVAFEAGRTTGDLTFPLPFAPEFYQSEFASRVADMKNSVKNRMNAQSSCAAQFVYAHIDDLDLPWLHIDLAGPSFRGERGTGYGVALISRIVETLTEAALKE